MGSMFDQKPQKLIFDMRQNEVSPPSANAVNKERVRSSSTKKRGVSRQSDEKAASSNEI
jgi:hypothetical protein